MNKKGAHHTTKRWAILAVLGVTVGIASSYHMQLSESTAYLGVRYIPLTYASALYWFTITFIFSAIFPASPKRPSEYFLASYAMLIALPHFVLLEAGHELPRHVTMLGLFIVVSPLAMAVLADHLPVRVSLPRLVPWGLSVWALVCVAVSVSIYLFLFGPPSSGWSLETSYVRRLEGRSLFPERSLSAYLLAMTLNSLAPYLAFVGACYKRQFFVFVSLMTAVAGYYSLGLKAPVAYFVIGATFGYLWTVWHHRAFYVSIAVTLYIATGAALLEYILYGFSELFEYVHRRAFVIPPLVTSAFLTFWDDTSAKNWDWMTGKKSAGDVKFEVGYNVFGGAEMNADTNAPIAAFVAEGIGGLTVALVLIGMYLVCLQAAHRSWGRVTCCFVALQAGFLFGEQAARTVLVSSGFLLLLGVELVSWGQHIPSVGSLVRGRPLGSRAIGLRSRFSMQRVGRWTR